MDIIGSWVPRKSGGAMPWSRHLDLPIIYISLYLAKIRLALVFWSWLSHFFLRLAFDRKADATAVKATGSVGHSELLCLEMRFFSKRSSFTTPHTLRLWCFDTSINLKPEICGQAPRWWILLTRWQTKSLTSWHQVECYQGTNLFVGAFILSVRSWIWKWWCSRILGEQVKEIIICPTRASLDFCWKEDKYDEWHIQAPMCSQIWVLRT